MSASVSAAEGMPAGGGPAAAGAPVAAAAAAASQPVAQYVLHQPYPGQGPAQVSPVPSGSFAHVQAQPPYAPTAPQHVYYGGGPPPGVAAMPGTVATVPVNGTAMVPLHDEAHRPSHEIPDPASIKEQKLNYEQQLDAELDQSRKMVEAQIRQAKDRLTTQAAQSRAVFEAQLLQSLKHQEFALDQQLQQHMMQSQQAMMHKKAALEQQASSLEMEYQQRKMQEEFAKQQTDMREEMMALHTQTQQETAEHQQQQAALHAQHLQHAQQFQHLPIQTATAIHPAPHPHAPGVPTAIHCAAPCSAPCAAPGTAPVYTATAVPHPVPANYAAYAAPTTTYTTSHYPAPVVHSPASGRPVDASQVLEPVAGGAGSAGTAGAAATYVLAAPNANGNVPPSAVSAMYGMGHAQPGMTVKQQVYCVPGTSGPAGGAGVSAPSSTGFSANTPGVWRPTGPSGAASLT